MLEETFEGAARVEVAGAAGEVAVGEEDLGGAQARGAKRALVAVHQQALTDGGGGLLGGQCAGAAIEAQTLDAQGHGAGADDDELSRSGDLGEVGGEAGEVDGVEVTALGEHACAEFHDESADMGKIAQGHGAFQRGKGRWAEKGAGPKIARSALSSGFTAPAAPTVSTKTRRRAAIQGRANQSPGSRGNPCRRSSKWRPGAFFESVFPTAPITSP